MATDYSKKKNVELQELLKSRSLPHTGKKDELVARLQHYDKEHSSTQDGSSKPAFTTKSVAKPATAAEDEIDWDDDAVIQTPTTKSDPNTTALAAGGIGQPTNPTAVPNQATDTDPSTTTDLTVEGKPTSPSKATGKPTEPAEPAEDFSSHLASTTLDAELAKRQKRAARFGIKETDEEALKAIERAKRFGTDNAEEGVAVKGLDEALPERRKKRGREEKGGEENGVAGGGGKRQDSRRRKGRGDVVAPSGKAGSGQKNERASKETKSASGLGEKDRLAAEARKKRFAAAA
ncbi:hypothetical protein MMC09_001409 [Bachmanniomyces sp. S44760]|nr:hypothetical protein [Bachmanniomyces sp. S44760]